MHNILKEICSLRGIAEKVFYGNLLGDNDKYLRQFLILLAEQSAAAQCEFLTSYPQDYQEYFGKKLSELQDYSEAEYRRSLEIIQDLLHNNEAEVKQLMAEREENKKKMISYRKLIKASRASSVSDQMLGMPPPPLQKPYPETAEIIDLPQEFGKVLKKSNILTCLQDRKSRRSFNSEALSLTELAFLLWSTQGVKEISNDKRLLRTVPSGGARHPFETWLAINNVSGLSPGIYRYLSLPHKLALISPDSNLKKKLIAQTYGQKFCGECAVCFIWTALPYRTEWRYTLQAKKDILIEAGHICQNLYLACEAINAGTCAIAAYRQKGIDALLGVDGEDEFTVYLAPVGKYYLF